MSDENTAQWMYNQRTGQLRNPQGILYEERGYSGIPEYEGVKYKNNPATEAIEDRGPIPRGAYIIGGDTRTKEPLTLILTPDGHNAHGRTLLRIHGDSKDHPGYASESCVILNKIQREAIHNSVHRRLMVVDEPEWK